MLHVFDDALCWGCGGREWAWCCCLSEALQHIRLLFPALHSHAESGHANRAFSTPSIDNKPGDVMTSRLPARPSEINQFRSDAL